ncbi:SRPBCC family protein [Streptomyces sp. NPDC048416]|uniref:SRPBCC family protein n=1 Tax=Streptomyces sp. NPDC048416 TaxID=3365546 RepID=UPI003714BDEF
MTEIITDAARGTGPAAAREIHRTQAAITVDAPAELVYRTLTDVTGWPLLYPWIVHTEIVERSGIEDLATFWAVRPGPEGGLRIWQSRRSLHDDTLRMVFEQRGSVGAIRELGGEWLFTDLEGGGCRVESHHWFTTDEDPALTAGELDRHGALQMRTLKEAVEGREQQSPLVLRAARDTLVPGTVKDVHARLSADLGLGGPATGETAGFGTAATEHPDGTTHDGRTVHIGRAPHTVVVKHLDPPAEFALYRRTWRLAEEADGVRVTAERLAVARPDTLAQDAQERRRALLTWLGEGAARDLPRGAGPFVK